MKTRFLLYIGAIMLLAACTKSFDDINTNQHQLTDEELANDYQNVGAFFSQMVSRVVLFDDGSGNCLSSDYQVAQGLSADPFSGYVGLTGTWRNGVHNGSYSFVSGWYDQMFTRAFSEVMPAWQRITKVAGEMNQPAVAALATIVKVEALHRVTDMYGPIPYIHFGSGSLGTTYDRQQEVYRKFFEELDEAINILTPLAESGGTLLPDYDNVYEGNVARWVKFANTLRLRLALRVAYADPALAQQEAEKSAACSIGFIETAAERAQLLHGRLTYFHPNYDMAYNFNAGEVRMGASMDCYMNGYSDPRLAAYLRAEAALRGWNMGGTAKAFYEAGIRASFNENGVSGDDAYIANSTLKPTRYVDRTGSNNGANAPSDITIAWNDEADFETNLERIITQKWIAMYPDGCEGWAEFRRTGYPRLLPVVNNDSQGLIDTQLQVRRCPFPVQEYNTNEAAVQAAIQLLDAEALDGGQDNGGTRLWWDKKVISD